LNGDGQRDPAVAHPRTLPAFATVKIQDRHHQKNDGDGVEKSGADSTVPVDLYIPGCPPHPATILDGLLMLLDKI
jgi:Ni,Fe-hydrogenase III small subunit